jgi:hypothetical protein
MKTRPLLSRTQSSGERRAQASNRLENGTRDVFVIPESEEVLNKGLIC